MSLELRQNLAEEIRAAFKDTVYPGDDQIGRRELKALAGQDWKTISFDLIKYYRSDIPLFYPKGFSYFLPAFLLEAILRSDQTTGFDLMDILSPEDFPVPEAEKDIWIHRWREEVVACLSKPQKEVIKKYFLSYRELDPYGHWSAWEDERQRLDNGIAYWMHIAE